MPEVDDDSFDPQKIYNELIERCLSVKRWEIRCIVEESWVGIAPFEIYIADGIFICFPIAASRREAFIEVANKLPVVKFLSRQDDE
jgi:hypothetical protein